MEAARKPEVVANLSACRSISGAAERLSCYDKAAAALDSAVEQRQITMFDRAAVRAARRSLFGLDLQSFPLFGGDKEKEKAERIDTLEAVVASAAMNGAGKWVVKLREGATWTQIDNNQLVQWPKAGSKVLIKRASLGSFMMRVDGQPGIRVKRSL